MGNTPPSPPNYIAENPSQWIYNPLDYPENAPTYGVATSSSPPPTNANGRVPYLYYQLFQNGRALPSYQRFNNASSTLGRVLRISIAPPRTTTNLCVCVLGREGFAMPDLKGVYFDDFDAPVSPNTPLSLAVGDVGTSPEEPLALIIQNAARRRPRRSGVLLNNTSGNIPLDPTDPTRVLPQVATYPGPGWRKGKTTTAVYLLDWNGGESVQNVSGAFSRAYIIQKGEDYG
ncbi:hypothetical protein DL93DRAFT_2230061 [Clavulina sp. PMI_390]|nr:hypothetical protein DL93DRAFT_2230061 [Clavulina sp. PMI_390]